MSAWKNVRVEATCLRCGGDGDVPFTEHYPCRECSGGRVSVPASEWAEALATVEGVEYVEVQDRPGGDYRDAVLFHFPASASTREDGVNKGLTDQ